MFKSPWFNAAAQRPEFQALVKPPQNDMTGAAGVAGGTPNTARDAVEPIRSSVQAQPGDWQGRPRPTVSALAPTGGGMNPARAPMSAASHIGGAIGGLFGGGGGGRGPAMKAAMGATPAARNMMPGTPQGPMRRMHQMGAAMGQGQPGGQMGQPGSGVGKKVMMQAPTGEQMEVTEYLVPHYQAKGARLIGGQ